MATAESPTTVSVELRSRVISGFAWKAASEGALQLSKLVVGLVLARLLTPHDYGVAGMVIVFSTIVPIFTDLGLGAALIHRETLTEDDRSTVFWITVATGVAMTAGCIALAAPLASYYREPQIRWLFIAFSSTFLFGSLSAVQLALLTKELNFRGLESRVIAGSLCGAAAGIVLAALGAGAWALVGQQIAFSVVSLVLLWRFSPWRPHVRFSWRSLHELGRYSGNVFGSHLVIQAGPNVNNLLIGRWAGAAALGAYTLSQNVILMPFNRIAAPIQEVLFPAFSKLQREPQRIEQLWLRMNRVIGAITFPALIGLVVVAPDFVEVVLGHKWANATPVIQILCWVGILQALQRLNLSILQARDRTGVLLTYSLGSVVLGIGAVAAGLHWGIVGVALAYALVSTLTLPVFTLITARAVDSTLWRCVRNLSGVAQATAGMAVAALVTRRLLVAYGYSAGPRLAVVVLVGAVVFVALAAWRAANVVSDLRDVAARVRHRGG